MKPPTCRAILITNCGSPNGAKAGQRCPEVAVEPAELPQLCWVHARALANRERTVPLEIVAMTLADRAELERWQAWQAAKAARGYR